MRSIIGQCPDCCECPAPSIEWDSRSASKTKCGFFESGDEPPYTAYRKRVLCADGKTTTQEYDAETCVLTTDVVCNPDCIPAGFTNPDDGLGYKKRTTTTHSVYVSELSTAPFQYTSCKSSRESTVTDVEEYVEATEEEGCFKYQITRTGTSVAMYQFWQLLPTLELLYSIECESTRNPDGTWNGSVTEDGETTTFENREYNCDGLGDCPEPVTNETTTDITYDSLADTGEDLSLEYTTETLIANTVASLPDWDDDWDDTAGSSRNLTEDELTYSIREARYRYIFPVPKVGRGTCFKINPWVERFTPSGGGAHVDTPKGPWTWGGDIPEDYDPSDPDTWPNYVLTIPVPESNGTTIVGYYTDPEDPETFVEGAPSSVCRGCA